MAAPPGVSPPPGHVRRTASTLLANERAADRAPVSSTKRINVRNASSVKPVPGKLYRSITSAVLDAGRPELRRAAFSLTFSRRLTEPKLMSRACLATCSVSLLVNGRSHARIWVRDTSSRSSAMLTTRNEANVPSWRTVSAPSGSSSAGRTSRSIDASRSGRDGTRRSRTAECATRIPRRPPTSRGGHSRARACPGICIQRRPPATA